MQYAILAMGAIFISGCISITQIADGCKKEHIKIGGLEIWANADCHAHLEETEE